MGDSDGKEKESSVEALILEADRAWKEGQREVSIETYENALRIVRNDHDALKEGMICLGLGFAMMNLEDDMEAEKAIPYLSRSLDIARKSGEKKQEEFLRHLIDGAEARKRKRKTVPISVSEGGASSESAIEKRSTNASELASRAFEKVTGIDVTKEKGNGGCCGGKKSRKDRNVAETHGKASKASIEREIRRAASDILGTDVITISAAHGDETDASCDEQDTTTWKRLGFHDLNSRDSNRFVRLVGQRLGDAFELPPAETLLKTCANVSELASFIMEHCPVDGNCSACPAKHRCEAHTDESKECADIEDAMGSECARKAASRRRSASKRTSATAAKV